MEARLVSLLSPLAQESYGANGLPVQALLFMVSLMRSPRDVLFNRRYISQDMEAG